MKLADTIIFYTACALTFVGIYEAMKHSVGVAYPFFMFATAMLFWYLYRKLQAKQKAQQEQQNKEQEQRELPWYKRKSGK